tara:strand:+ start:340 stop:543 length:204 start_codon:yes stop_codon:yes gene_type:complete
MQIEQWIKKIGQTKIDKVNEEYVWMYKPVLHTDLDNHIIIRLVACSGQQKHHIKKGGWKIYPLDNQQ